MLGDYGVGGFGGIQQLPDLNKPVIGAVHGLTMGGGFELALSCDLIYASASTQFGLPEINAGTLADAATIRLPKRMPYHVAMDLLLTGRWIDAAEAARWGLVNEVLPDDDAVRARAWEIARHLASGPPLVFAATKEVARATEAMTFADAMDLVTSSRLPTVAALYDSEDEKEGARRSRRSASRCGRGAEPAAWGWPRRSCGNPPGDRGRHRRSSRCVRIATCSRRGPGRRRPGPVPARDVGRRGVDRRLRRRRRRRVR